jgi:hypothetical protein
MCKISDFVRRISDALGNQGRIENFSYFVTDLVICLDVKCGAGS